MDFLKDIIRRIMKNGGANFREQVKQEKRQKYLFRDEEDAKHVSSRNTFFRKKRKEFFKFAKIFGGSFEYFHNHLRESQMLGYMGVFLIFLTAYVVVFSPYFKISPNKVLVESDTPGIDINIAYRALEDLYGRSIFLLDEEGTAISLKKSLRNISRVRIEKLYPNGIKVLISWAPIRYTAYITGIDKRYGMSENWVLVPESAISTWATDTIEINSEYLRAEPFLDYKQVLSDDTIFIIGKVLSLFHDEWNDFVLGRTRYFSQENELHISLESWTKIIVTLQDEVWLQNINDRIDFVKRQLVTLKSYILSHREDFLNGSITYVDARVDKKLFLCRPKDTCMQNLVLVYGQIYAE